MTSVRQVVPEDAREPSRRLESILLFDRGESLFHLGHFEAAGLSMIIHQLGMPSFPTDLSIVPIPTHFAVQILASCRALLSRDCRAVG